ncbi:MAG TPA: TetR/AcrR family transcriptional regulator [Phenylobacterium sp.]|uniref:TetR/AcrR family transcriptional regulator n=1 Tax=Phenylobacterium sp. TaxID=1871053 RepID=UPI002D31FC53|nr:TetR/AcrR family transcriptional regulator [Phenylobacterium sp.]HZZ70095.1 TetR/AcrR family transcriptional regulator [Phenylobacterium sp.]
MPRTPRPGGRTARTKAAVFEAAAELVAERGHEAVAMTDIAKRARVAATSLYRRWGDVRALLLEVAVEKLAADSPLPDTGSLRSDLRVWARRIAASLRAPGGSPFFRIMLANAPPPDDGDMGRATALGSRLQQIAAMLDRAAARGEAAPPLMDVIDHLLAPIYMRALFGAPIGAAFAHDLADRLCGPAKGDSQI